MKKRAFGKLYKDLFYIPGQERLPDKVFRCRMVTSLLTILGCTVVMAASTFALFYMDISTDNTTLAGAYYTVTVDKGENGTYICPLVYEDKHIFEIKAEGTATTGYCKIQVGEQIYYTEPIPRDWSLTLTVQAAKDTPIIFTPQWGMSSDYVNAGTCGNEIIHSATAYAFYKVEPTAKLVDIAVHYGVSEADILTYNNITEIAENMNLKIPGVACDVASYVASVPEQTIEEGENGESGIDSENSDSLMVGDMVSGGDAGTGKQLTEETVPTGEIVSSGDMEQMNN